MAQGLGNLGDKVEGFPPVELIALSLHVLLQGNAVDELHDNVLQLRGPAHVIYSHNIGMREHGHGLGLIMEAAAEFGVLGQLLPQDFDGHQPVQPVVSGLVDLGHAARSHKLQYLISVIE